MLSGFCYRKRYCIFICTLLRYKSYRIILSKRKNNVIKISSKYKKIKFNSFYYIFDTRFFNIFGMNCLKMARIGILWYTNPMSKRLYLF